MRIAYVSTRSDVVGGSNVHIRDLACAVQSLGHEVVVLGGGDGPFAAEVRRHGLGYRPLRHLARPIRPHRDVAAVAELRAELRRLRPDLLSLHTAKAGVVGRLAVVGSGTPVVYTPHGWTFTPGVPAAEAALYARLERVVAPLATRIVDVCTFERSIALERRVGRPAQHVVVHNGMPDVDAALRARPGDAPPRLVMVARHEIPKDHATLLAALADSRDLPWTLDLVGGGPLEGATRSLAERLGLADRVTFLGPRDDVAAVLARAQAFVLSTRWEGFPRSILEAMRAGLPVVATDVGGVHEAVEDGASGFVVPPGDAASLADRLRRLLVEPGLRTRLGARGRERYLERFTFAVMLERTLEVYEAALGRRP